MSKIQQVNRRDFVKLIGLASGGILLGCNVSSSQKEFVASRERNFYSKLIHTNTERWYDYLIGFSFGNGARN